MTVKSPEFRATIDGESSPAITKSSDFRELDDAFLQTQTRVWLGEVLQIRFDEETNICDLLADGELLLEVSEALSRMSPSLSLNATQPKANEWKSFASSKSTRRYMPYYNVGSFLKMCKNLGMNGIDLFTPSDVVEKRNTRKVCMCIRSLSKKARSRDLNVPDFDSVTCTLAMPTGMVECIRKSLEMSQCSSSHSVGQESENLSRVRCWKGMSNSASAVSNGHSSDICDDAESSYVVGQSLDDAYDAESQIVPCSDVVKDFSLALQFNRRDLEIEDHDQCEYLSPSNAESVGSPCSQYFSDQEFSMPSSNCHGSRISGFAPEEEYGDPKHGYQNGDVHHVPIIWEDRLLDCRDHRDDNAIIHDARHEFLDKIICAEGNNTSDAQFENLTHTSENKCEKSVHDTVEQVSCAKFVLVGGGEMEGDPESVVADNFRASEAPIACLEDAQTDNNTTNHGLVIYGLSHYIGKSFSDEQVEDENHSSELLEERGSYAFQPENPDFPSYSDENHLSQPCTEVTNVGRSYVDTSKNVNNTSEDVSGQMRFHVEQPPCSADPCACACKCSVPLAVKLDGFDDHCIPPRSVAETGASDQLLSGSDSTVSVETDCSLTKRDSQASGCNMITSEHSEECLDKYGLGGEANVSSDMRHVDLSYSRDVGVVKDELKCSRKNSQDTWLASEDHTALDVNNNSKLAYRNDVDLVNSLTNSLGHPQPEAEFPESSEDTGHKHPESAKHMEEGKSEDAEQEGSSKETPLHKPQRKLLKSVVKGTALLGIAAFLLHLAKNRQENLSKLKKQPIEVLKRSAPSPSLQKGQKSGNTSSVYPAEKLHFG